MKKNLLALMISIFALNVAWAGPTNCDVVEPEPRPTTFQEAARILHGQLKCVQLNLGDGTKNADSALRIEMILPIIEAAAKSPLPTNVKTETMIEFVGEEAAKLKFSSLVMIEKVTLLELQGKLRKLGAEACGMVCADYMKQVHLLKDVGHMAFRE